MIFLRKFLGLFLTTLVTGILLTFLFVLTEGTNPLVMLTFLTGAFPFVLLIGVPVSFLSDFLTVKLNGEPRRVVALLIHSIFGLIAGLVISYLFENEDVFLVGLSIIAALIFWLVDEISRKKLRRKKTNSMNQVT